MNWIVLAEIEFSPGERGRNGGIGTHARYFDVPIWLGVICLTIVLTIIVLLFFNKKPKKDEWEDKKEDY